jgi:DNA polymerase-3 subunit delta'
VLGLDQIRDQQRPVGLLVTLIRKDRLPHALIFTGVEGVGKKTAALALASVCNCENRRIVPSPAVDGSGPTMPELPVACQECRPCRWIMAGNHPDVIRIDPAGAMIRIDQIRGLLGTLSQKPFGTGRRVVIINNAHSMNPEAANALLKMLEEPPDATVLILTAPQTADLLPTIVSRCQHVRFRPLTIPTLTALLTTQDGLDPGEAEILAQMAAGSYTRARAMYRDGWVARRNWLVREIDALPTRTAVQHLALAEQLAAMKQHLPDALECMLNYYRDLLVWRYHPDTIINRDLEAEIERSAARQTAGGLIDRIRATQEALKRLSANANPRLTLETLILQLKAA